MCVCVCVERERGGGERGRERGERERERERVCQVPYNEDNCWQQSKHITYILNSSTTI